MTQPIGWQTLKAGWFNMLVYVIFIASIIIFRPPIYIILIALAVMVLAKQLYAKQLTLKRYLRSMIILYCFFGVMYGVYKLVGGIWAIIIAHVMGISVIIYFNWEFIKQADSQLKAQIDYIKKKRGG